MCPDSLLSSTLYNSFTYLLTKSLGMQASINQCLSQARTNWEGCGRKGIRHKNGGGDGDAVSSDGEASTQTVGASASIIVPCSTKSRNNDSEK